MSSRLPLRLVDRQLIAPDVLHLALEHEDQQPLPFKPGQFIQIFFIDADGQEQRRSFSLANAPDADADGAARRWELAISLLPGGKTSAWAQQVPLNTRVEALGPFGRFHLMPNDRAPRYLLLATGTGVAPFRAMLPQLQQRIADTGIEVILLCGARTRAELLYLDEFRALATSTPRFQYRGCITRETPPEREPDLIAGRILAPMKALNPQPDDLVLLCGNPAMVDDCAEWLKETGLPARNIRRERYISSS